MPNKKYKNRIVPTNINRVDDSKGIYHGFQVRIYTMKYSKMFPDKSLGGWTNSLDAAIKHLKEKEKECQENGIKFIRTIKRAHLNSSSRKFKKKKIKIIAGISFYAYWSKTMNDYKLYFIVSYNSKPYKQNQKKVEIGYFNSITQNKFNRIYRECIKLRSELISKLDKNISKQIDEFDIPELPVDLSLATIDKRRMKDENNLNIKIKRSERERELSF